MFKTLTTGLALLAGVSAAKFGAWNYHGMSHGDAIPGEYLVMLKDDASLKSSRDFIQSFADLTGANVHYAKKTGLPVYGLRGVNAKDVATLKGYYGVEMVTPNQVVTISGLENKPIKDADVPCRTETVPDKKWGLARTTAGLSWNSSTREYSYSRGADETGCGAGVQLHVLDTGVDFDHYEFRNLEEFASGDFTLEGDFDGHGHGTHVASTAAGAEYGFARCTQVVSLKVLASSGAGNLFGILGALEISQEEAQKGNKVVTNMSLGALVNPILNAVATDVAASGVLLTAAAGNDNTDAALSSPASADGVWTIAASNRMDTRAPFSNYGSVVNIFAPGQDITAACPLETYDNPIPVASCGQLPRDTAVDCNDFNGRRHCYSTISGTSMACPHAAGVATVYWGLPENAGLTNVEIQAVIEREAVANVLPRDEIGAGSPNLLLQSACGTN